MHVDDVAVCTDFGLDEQTLAMTTSDEAILHEANNSCQSDEREDFEHAVLFASHAIEEAACLNAPDTAVTGTDALGELSLSYDDWFRLRGLLLCSRFGACEEKYGSPRWFDWKAAKHRRAWQAQGRLPIAEARRRFCVEVSKLPGFPGFGHSSAACLTIVCPFALPCVGARSASPPLQRFELSLLGLIMLRFQPPQPQALIFEDAEASRRRLLAARHQQLQRGPPGTLESFVGRWRHLRTDGLDEYLRAFGVSFTRRSIAKAYAPSPHFCVEGARLCISTASPIGKYLEWLHPGGAPTHETDPEGHAFRKTVSWDGERLVSTFKSDDISDVVTTRWIELQRQGSIAIMVQETRWEGVSFTRRFQRDA
jgi:hypothetical protein